MHQFHWWKFSSNHFHGRPDEDSGNPSKICEFLVRLFYSIIFEQKYAYYLQLQQVHSLRTFSKKQDKISFDGAESILLRQRRRVVV